MKSVSVIIPAYNEREGIGKVIQEVLAEVSDCEIIVVDDGSSDDTADVASQYRVLLVKHRNNIGQYNAIMSGVEQASTDMIVTTDADYTYPAKSINRILELTNQGYDLVIGNRIEKGVHNIPLVNRMGNRILSYMVSLVSGQNITDAQSGLRAFRKSILRDLGMKSRSLEYATEMTARTILAGYKVIEVPIDYRPRLGRSKLRPLRDGITMLRAVWNLLVEVAPPAIKSFFIVPGLLSIIVSLFLTATTIFLYFTGELINHQYVPLLTLLFLLAGIQLSGFGFVLNVLTVNIKRIEKRLH